MSVGTAFFPRTSQLNQKLAWGEWSGYFSAAVYADFHDIEYNAIREAAALIDASPLYKYVISGPDAARLVDRVMTRDVRRLSVDQVFYTAWCDERGKLIDDGTVIRRGENEFLWTAADLTYRWFSLNTHGLDVEITDVTDDLACLAVQGPLSRALLEAVTGADWSDLRYFRRRVTQIGGVDVEVTRTGYTGDLGYELWVPVDGALAMWDAIWDRGKDYGARPAGIRALDVARVEAGLILAEVEYTSVRHAVSPEQEYSPFEVGLGRLVEFGKADFVGKRALMAEQTEGGPRRRLAGLALEWSGIEGIFAKHGLPPAVSPMVQREPVALYRQGHHVGRVTSIVWSPTLKTMIGFGSVPPSLAALGTKLEVEWSVEGESGTVPATVVDLPFLDLPRKRA